jgi:hypothetical protein
LMPPSSGLVECLNAMNHMLSSPRAVIVKIVAAARLREDAESTYLGHSYRGTH